MENSDLEQQKKQKANNKKDKKHFKQTGFYYSFLTIALLFCLIQIGYGAIMNVSKIIAYQGKTVTLQNLLKKAQARNQDLKAEKKMVTSDNSLEGIARNNLKMAGEDEVLIIINQKVEQKNTKKDKWNFKNLFKKKKKTQQEEAPDNIYIPEEVVEE